MGRSFGRAVGAGMAIVLGAGCNGFGGGSGTPATPGATSPGSGGSNAPDTPGNDSPPNAPGPSPSPPSAPPPAPSPPPSPVPMVTTLPGPPPGSTRNLLSRVAEFTPPENPLTAAKVVLGKAIFWDQQLGARSNQACATCHAFAGTDPRSFDATGNLVTASLNPGPDGILGTADDIVGSMGVVAGTIVRSATGFTVVDDFTPRFFMPPAKQVTGRQAPTMINAIFNKLNFWDGRASNTFKALDGTVVCADNASAESQAVGPPLSPVEMGCSGENWADLTNKIAHCSVLALQAGPNGADIQNVSMLQGVFGRTYPELFRAAFGDPAVTRERIGEAIASYERILISDATPFDHFNAGDQTALTGQMAFGFNIFNGKGNCTHCHLQGWTTDAVSDRLLSNDGTQGFHRVGIRPISDDLGRGKITLNPADDGLFKTPNLRNVRLTAPYFHTGGMKTLEALVDFYDRGGDFPGQNPEIRPLGLTVDEKAALVAFLRDGLTDPNVEAQAPPFDHPPLR